MEISHSFLIINTENFIDILGEIYTSNWCYIKVMIRYVNVIKLDEIELFDDIKHFTGLSLQFKWVFTHAEIKTKAWTF